MTTSGDTRISSSVWSRFSRTLRRLGGLASAAAALLYPPACVSCGRDLPEGGILCPACTLRLRRPEGARCALCGAEVEDPLADLCLACGTRVRAFDRVYALGSYDELWGELVCTFKFDGERAVGRWLAARLAAAARSELVEEYDVVSFVPMAWGERRSRGFNQARALALGVARRLERPMRRTLAKARRTAPQAALSARRRRENLRGAFRAIRSGTGRVLLVDDICTTGSTADACARALKDAGWASVDVLVVARA